MELFEDTHSVVLYCCVETIVFIIKSCLGSNDLVLFAALNKFDTVFQ
jgi:hypothetical protein